MKRQTVISSAIASVGYNPSRSLLEIELTNHTIYQYHDVPMDVYKDLMKASSHGEYYNEAIKNNYTYTRIK